MKERILFLSDVHHCSENFYGVPAEERLDKLLADLDNAGKFDRTFLLGDLSLDFWLYNGGGSWQKSAESRTARFMETYAPHLPAPLTVVPGNHEQYGEEHWARFTGQSRSAVVESACGLFIFPDTFGGVLDPADPSDGKYRPADCDFIRATLAASAPDACPHKPVFLCSHYFDMAAESEDFKALLAENPRILALLMGHTHHSAVLSTGSDAGNKPILQTGNYSYSAFHERPQDSFWGWRELIFHDDGRIESFYHVPTNAQFGVQEHDQDTWEITL